VAVTATAVAVGQQQAALDAEREAVTAREVAESRQLAGQSAALRETNPDLASLLAVQAYRTRPTTEASNSLYAAADLALRHRLTGHLNGVEAVAFGPDGATLATGSYEDGTARLWDIATGQSRYTLAHLGWEPEVAVLPDGATLVVGSREGSALFDLATGERRHTLTGDWTTAVAFSPDGTTLATGRRNDATVRLWDVSTGEIARTLSAHPHTVAPLAFSPGGATLAIGGSDGTATLADSSTGETRAQLTGHTSSVESLAFSPDGGHLVTSGDDDGTARVWDIALPTPEEATDQICRAIKRDLTQEERARCLPDPSAEPACPPRSWSDQ
jgi:WD40 repeat protein